MRTLLATIVLMSVSFVALSQSEITLTKQEFIDNQLEMFSQLDAIQTKASADTEQMMKSKMAPEAYEEYQKEKDVAEQEEMKLAADCLGISVEKMESITTSIDSAVLVEATNLCSAKLPDSITISGMDWTDNASLAEYNSCNEQFIADKSGVPLEKYKECAAKQEQQ